jgi:hypothetical protein
MIVGDGFRPQIEALPGGTWITQTISALTAAVTTSFHREHNVNDTHGVVTADTLRSRAAIYELTRTVGMGYFADVQPVFDATQFTTSGAGGWTVTLATVIAYRFMRVGNAVFLSFHLGGTTVTAATGTTLYLPLPLGVVQPRVVPGVDWLQENFCRILDNGVSSAGRCFVESPDTARMAITRLDGAALTASVANTGVRGQLWLEAAA